MWVVAWGAHAPGSVVSPALPSIQSGPGCQGLEGCTSPGPHRGTLLPPQIPPHPGLRIPPFPAQDCSTQWPCTLHVSAFVPLNWWFAAGELMWVTHRQLVTTWDGLFVIHPEKEPPVSYRQGACIFLKMQLLSLCFKIWIKEIKECRSILAANSLGHIHDDFLRVNFHK